MKALDQQKELYNFYYRNSPNKVPYADLLVLYETIKDGQQVDIDGLKLFPELILDYTIPYYAGVNILISYLN